MEPPKLPTLYPKQAEAINCTARYTLIEASTKAGKTAGCLIWLLSYAWNSQGENRNYWWVAPVAPQAKIAFRRMKRMLRQSDPEGITWHTNETELRIELHNGAAIWFKGSDDPDNLYGDDVYAAVIDEASRCKEDSWHAVRSTLTSTGGPVKIIGNVRGRKNWAYRLARKAQAGAHNMAYFKLTAMDAVEGGVLPLSEVEDAKGALPLDVFKQLYLAEAADDGGNPFGIDAINLVWQENLLPGPAVCYGIDLAKSSDWTVVVGLNAYGGVCQLERWQSNWEITVEKIVSIVGDRPALIDSTGVGDPIVEKLKQRINCQGYKFTAQSKQQLMEGLAVAIQQQTIKVATGWLKNELEAFEYEYGRSGVKYTAPPGMHDDGVCALALAVMCKLVKRMLKAVGGAIYIPSMLEIMQIQQVQEHGSPGLPNDRAMLRAERYHTAGRRIPAHILEVRQRLADMRHRIMSRVVGTVVPEAVHQ